jgi:hypothetical protein
VDGVPVKAPVPELITNPAGKPTADHEATVAVVDESVGVSWRGRMGVPDIDVWLPGLETLTILTMVHLNEVDPE